MIREHGNGQEQSDESEFVSLSLMEMCRISQCCCISIQTPRDADCDFVEPQIYPCLLEEVSMIVLVAI